MNYDPMRNAQNPALQGRNPAFMPASSPAVSNPGGNFGAAGGLSGSVAPQGSPAGVAPVGAFAVAPQPAALNQMGGAMPVGVAPPNQEGWGRGIAQQMGGPSGWFGTAPTARPNAMGGGLSGFGGQGGNGILGGAGAFGGGMSGRGR